MNDELFFFAPPNTPIEEPDKWDPLGVDKVVLGFDGISADSMVIPTAKLDTTIQFSQVDQGILWAQPEPEPMSFRIDYEQPTLPPKAKKGRLVGKAWRKYCRDYRRARQQWVKDGRPTRSMSFYMPRVDVTFDELSQTMTAVAVQADKTAKAISVFADAFAMHPSNWKQKG